MSVISGLGLTMFLGGCANPTEPTAAELVMTLPPAGLIVPCYKPTVKATTPEVTASEDVPKLKAALSECAGQVNDYLNWRSKQTQFDH